MQPDGNGQLSARPWRFTPVRVLALGLLAAGLVASVAGDPYRGSRVRVDTRDLALRAGTGADSVAATDLADWIIQGRDDYTLVDLRAAKDFDAYHIPGALNVALASLTPSSFTRNQKIVLSSNDGTQAAKGLFLLQTEGFKSVYLIDGGLRAWRDAVLFPMKTSSSDAAAFEKQVLVARYFGGAPRL